MGCWRGKHASQPYAGDGSLQARPTQRVVSVPTQQPPPFPSSADVKDMMGSIQNNGCLGCFKAWRGWARLGQAGRKGRHAHHLPANRTGQG